MFETKSKKKFLWMQLQCFSVGFSVLFSCFKLHDNLQEYWFVTDGKNSWKEILMGNWKWWKNVEGTFDGKPKMVKKPVRKFWWKTQNGEKTWKENEMGILRKEEKNKKEKRWSFCRWKKKMEVFFRWCKFSESDPLCWRNTIVGHFNWMYRSKIVKCRILDWKRCFIFHVSKTHTTCFNCSTVSTVYQHVSC